MKTREKVGVGAEHILRALFDSLDAGVVLLDSNGQVLEINSASRRLCGDAHSVFGSAGQGGPAAILRDDGTPFPPEEQPARRALKTGRPVRNVEMGVTDAGGTLRWLLANAEPLVGNEGQPSGVVVSFVDITERRQVELQRVLSDEATQPLRERFFELDAIKRIHRVCARFFDAPGSQAVWEEILEAAIAITDAGFGNIQVFDPRSSRLEIVAHRGLPDWWLEYWRSARKGWGACGMALQSQGPVVVEDVSQSPIYMGTEALDIQLRAGIRAEQSTPLLAQSGSPLGVISTYYGAPRQPSAKAFQYLELLARQAAGILDRMQSEAALRRSEARAAGILEISADAVISIDERQRITQWNLGAEKMFGYTCAEATGMLLDRLLPERYREAHREQVALFGRETDVARMMDHSTAVGLRKSGEEFPISATISTLEVDGELVMTVSVRDVTEWQRTEVAQRILAEIGGALSALECKNALTNTARILASLLADVVVLVGLEENASLLRLASATRNPAQALLTDAMFEVPSEGARVGHPLRQAIEQRSHFLVQLDSEGYEAFVPGPEHLPALEAAAPKSALVVPLVVGNDCLGALGLVSTSRRLDEHDVQLAEEIGKRCALYRQNARLHEREKRAVRTRDEVLAFVAHDLRNPLNKIVMQLQLLCRHGSAPERRSLRPIRAIHRTVQRMNRIIEDLLVVARFDSGRFEVEPRKVSASDLVAEAIDSQRDQVVAASLEFRCSIPSDLPPVLADRERVLRVFENLIGNAVKFTKEGYICVSAKAEARDVVFSVTDTGVGIAEKDLPCLFDQFWQGQDSTRTGVGLGLAIAQAIVASHGGRLWADSQLGVGSTFSFTLKAAAEQAANDEAAPTTAVRRSAHAALTVADKNTLGGPDAS